MFGEIERFQNRRRDLHDVGIFEIAAAGEAIASHDDASVWRMSRIIDADARLHRIQTLVADIVIHAVDEIMEVDDKIGRFGILFSVVGRFEYLIIEFFSFRAANIFQLTGEFANEFGFIFTEAVDAALISAACDCPGFPPVNMFVV